MQMTLGIRQRLNFRTEDVQTWSPECRTWFLNPEENFSAQMLLFQGSRDSKASCNLHYLLLQRMSVVSSCMIHQYMLFERTKRFATRKYVTLRMQSGREWCIKCFIEVSLKKSKCTQFKLSSALFETLLRSRLKLSSLLVILWFKSVVVCDFSLLAAKPFQTQLVTGCSFTAQKT